MENNQNGSQKVMKASEVSRFLRMPLSTVYNLAVQGKIPAVKFGRQWRFLEQDILNYLNGLPSQASRSGIGENEKRQHPRMKTEIEAVLTGGLRQTQSLCREGMILNLSECGAFFVPQASGLETGDPIKIQFILPNHASTPCRLEGRIVHQDRYSKKGLGIKFREMTSEIREAIKNYVG